jgi:CheY-like chemotaxis protein
LVVDSDRRRRRLWCAAGGAWGLKITAVEDPSASDQGLPGGSFDLVILGGGAPSPALVRWLGPGGAGQGVPRVWANRTDTDLGPPGASERRLAASFIDLAELARLLAEVVNRTPAAKSPPGKPGVGGGVPVLGQRLPLRILAADDIRTNRAMLSRMMQFLGYTIDLVENGAEVLDAVRQNPYDLILLDVQMPVMDGLTAARTLVNLYPDRSTRPRIVALTANALHGDREACLAAGMDEYLSKPILPKDIERCIERLFTPNPTISTGGVSGANAAVGVDLPWLDREHLQTVFPGLPNGEFRDTLVELIGVAGEDFGRMRPQLIDACRVRDMKAVAECAHALKGCFATLAWTRAARFCADAVVRARQGGFSEWDSLPADLDRLYAASSAALTSYLAEGAGSAAEFREQSAA